jgi:hypothetical protein
MPLPPLVRQVVDKKLDTWSGQSKKGDALVFLRFYARRKAHGMGHGMPSETGETRGRARRGKSGEIDSGKLGAWSGQKIIA